MAIYQDLVDDHGFTAGYASVKRFVHKLRGETTPEARVVITTAPGQEGQVDYGEGPMVRDPETGKYKRTRLFVLTLGFSRKSVRLLSWRSSTQIWSELHERAFRRLGGCPSVIVHDNLREGVITPDIYDPTLNPLYRDVLAHYGVVAVPCRVRDPDRKGKVESGVGHAQKTPLRGLRFESLEEAQAYLDRWETNWADTRIHGTTKRQVSVMFAEEKPHLRELPVEPFRYYRYGERTVHLDGCVEVEAAYYGAPPGWIGRRVQVQWDGVRVRIVDPTTGALLREHLRQERGRHRIADDDRPSKTPATTAALLRKARSAGPHIGALCDRDPSPRWGARRAPRPGCALAREEARRACRRRCSEGRARPRRVELPLPAPLPRTSPAGAADAQAGRPDHPTALALPRSHPKEDRRMNLIELDRALRKLRLSGMANVLETRLRQAQTEKLAPIDLVSALVWRRSYPRSPRRCESHLSQPSSEPSRKTDEPGLASRHAETRMSHIVLTGSIPRLWLRRRCALYTTSTGETQGRRSSN